MATITLDHFKKEYDSISKLAKETAEPIFVTNNWDVDLVIMSVKVYELLALKNSLLSVEIARLNRNPSYTLDEAKLKFKNTEDKP